MGPRDRRRWPFDFTGALEEGFTAAARTAFFVRAAIGVLLFIVLR
jgi:hypothetical protein